LTAAVADADDAVRRGPADARGYYNAARVHAQAGMKHPDPSAAAVALGRAAELLGRAAAATPAANRPRFWAEFVAADKVFDPLRRSGRMAALEASFAAAPK
jgi:hypothetical protein